ncbi:hypothetical protein ACFQS6_19700 [Xanthomonas populi]
MFEVPISLHGAGFCRCFAQQNARVVAEAGSGIYNCLRGCSRTLCRYFRDASHKHYAAIATLVERVDTNLELGWPDATKADCKIWSINGLPEEKEDPHVLEHGPPMRLEDRERD